VSGRRAGRCFLCRGERVAPQPVPKRCLFILGGCQ
jgi:hypothetical protein